tara:strand:- start:58472 stop:59836 length:1365 start_codon:yes stop_codon:yes gene_type:complete
MKYFSTRGQSPELSFCEVVATGLAPDGGLYLPENLPDIGQNLEKWSSLSYAELSFEFLSLFATDIPKDRLQEIIQRSYQNFDHPKTAPLKQLDQNLFVLELFHGPTLAFKDYPLQLLGNLYEEQIHRTGIPINVLGATSGDTGSAAIHSLLGKKNINIFILYPEGRIAPLQERQITCSGAENVYPLAIKGTFDDAQKIVKTIFKDQAFNQKHHLSAVNSINLARILSQCVYYIYAWLRLPKDARTNVEVIAPSGNFGNVFSGWLAQKMGLPIASLRIATNQNDILYRLFTTGRYEKGSVRPSFAPSMDIQVSSNLERFIYFHEHENTQKVCSIMKTFSETGTYTFDPFNPSSFTASRTTDKEIPSIIREVHERYNYILDPHTACGFKGFQNQSKDKTHIVLATAHPAKFPQVIEQAIGLSTTHPSLDALQTKPIKNYILPGDTRIIQDFIEKHA